MSSADAYQMHAYASAYGCHDVRLLYPWHSGLLGFAGHIYELATTGTIKPLLQLGFVAAKRSPLMLVSNPRGTDGRSRSSDSSVHGAMVCPQGTGRDDEHQILGNFPDLTRADIGAALAFAAARECRVANSVA